MSLDNATEQAPQRRAATAVDRLAERHLDTTFAHDPILATEAGIAGHDGELPALDPDWLVQRSEHRRAVLRELESVDPVDDVDWVTIAALRSDLEAAEAVRAVGAEESALNVAHSPVQDLRDIIDLNATDSVDHWADIADRLAALPASLRGYTESLRLAASRGDVSSARQITATLVQAQQNVGADGFFAGFARDARTADGAELPDAVRRDVERGAAAAGAAYGELVDFLRGELLPRAGTRDAVGRDAYTAHSRYWVGASVDLDETYAWAQEQMASIVAAMQATAERIAAGASVAEAIATLDADPARRIEGTEALQAWMQRTSDEAVDALAGTHFDIPDSIRTLQCRIAPTHTGGIYYTGPSEDLVTRPGRMWWSVPTGVASFSTWQERTVVYHEGVPGHHLQIAQTMLRRDTLNRWRRLGSWTSGHGEGWALYAEQLMADLGFLDDPGDLLGMLDSQSLRAARVVIDIGVHCELPAPAEVGGGAWDYDKAWRYLSAHCNSNEPMLRYELDRYLGWPGQAPSYKIGQRLWEQIRDEARARDGAQFDLARFHRRALDIGSVGLDVLRDALAG